MTTSLSAHPRDAVLTRIYTLMAEIVPGRIFSQPDLSFLEAGLDSMKSILLVSRLEDAFGLEFEAGHLSREYLGTPGLIADLLLTHYQVN